MRRALLPLAALCLLATGARRPADCSGDYCGTLVFAAGGQPDILLPPVSVSALSRDIHDQIFLKLADIGMTLNTVGDRGFVPVLAKRWEWRDSLTLVFHLDPRARWQDGPPVTAGDVAFTFQAYTDPQVNSSSAPILAHIASVTARDSLTAVFRFRDRYPEMFYDAVYHMRILPAHLLASVPRDHWMSADFGRAPVGDGPYRFVTWTPEYLELAADSTFFLGRPHIRRLLWRFTPNLDVAITQLIADQADALETLGPPPNVRRVQAATQLALYHYSGTNYAFLQFNLAANGDTTRPHPILSDRQVRRAITMAVDRVKLCQSVWGDLAKAPPGPMPQAWWIWNVGATPLPYDTTQAARLLTADGWVDSDGDGIRDKGGVKLSIGRAVRRRIARVEYRSHAVLELCAALDPRGLEPLQLRPLRQSQSRATVGSGDTLRRRSAVRRARVARRARHVEPGRAGHLAVRAGQRRSGAQPRGRRHHPPRLVVGAGVDLAHPSRPPARPRPHGTLTWGRGSHAA